MSLSFNQQLRILKTKEPTLYEAISRLYKASLFEDSESPEIGDTTKANKSQMDILQSMVGVNPDKKEGDEIFGTDENPEIPEVTANPEQNPLGYGLDTEQEQPEETSDDNQESQPEETSESKETEETSSEETQYNKNKETDKSDVENPFEGLLPDIDSPPASKVKSTVPDGE